jgi:hypothetical protein
MYSILACGIALCLGALSSAPARAEGGQARSSTAAIAPVNAAPPALAGNSAAAVVPYRYAQVVSRGLAVYAQPGDSAPVRHYTSAGTWVSILDQRVVDHELWYAIDRGGWVPASTVRERGLSQFRGVRVTPEMPLPFGFVTADILNVRTQPGVASDNLPIGELRRYDVVPILEQTEGGSWYRIGDGQWVAADYVARVAPTLKPEGVGDGERWVAVNLREQVLTAYEGSELVYATLVSTGLPRWPTVTGLFRVWIKIKHRKMSGGSLAAGDYYYLPDVPWTQYFHGGYALHAAYWHDDFGSPKSHGCVNLSPLDAYWIFQWASPEVPEDKAALRTSADNPGLWVFVHNGTQPEVFQ